MATLLFSAAGAALGGSIGGTFAGLSSVAIGRAVGATLGRVVDQRLLGQGADAVETGKVDRFRLTNAGEGSAISQVYGRMRMGGHLIWASDFIETVAVSGGGKGSRPSPEVSEYSYAVSLAIGICEGKITRIGRVWADGEEVAPKDLNMRVYDGTSDQLPDPVMEAIEGAGRVPAYRGTAYVVMEDLSLAQFGNRIPQFSFEVIRPEQPDAPGREHTPAFGIRGVAIIPGTGEYELATSPVNYDLGDGVLQSANVSTPAAEPDFAHCVEAVCDELPNLEAASLVVSWFGDDLRCGDCTVRPKVEQKEVDSPEMPWTSGGIDRPAAEVIVQDDGRPVYGGTPTDAAVIEAIQALSAAGKAVMYYPFILMDPFKGNELPDPYSDNGFQPNLPWRGRITLSEAPGRPGSPDGTAQAVSEVDAFFGTAIAADFAVVDGAVSYSGPAEWGLNRFILHNAALCLAAGGVEAFCIGSEMRGLTQIRGPGNSFPAVARLRGLAAEVRSLLGPETRLSYAADWSEYFGYAPQDGSNDRFFHLDPLWADHNIDFIGIDNYMPLADWRDEEGHLDGVDWDAIYDLDYLKSNIEGGEGYDWYYHSETARAAQIRTDITDGDYGEPWVHRYKDLRGWWENTHHDRIGGVRAESPTSWQPKSKPIWFTEYGCGAVDKGANQPNKFLDRKSSESLLPRFSNGARDELIQMQYLRAMSEYWAEPANNPMSSEYEGQMLDMSRAFVWAWDSRPYPFFPNDVERWSDGENYARGHWINGRTSSRSLASVVREICERAGLADYSTEGIYGYLRGYAVEQVGDARTALQPLMIRYGFDAVERGGVLRFRPRDGLAPEAIEVGLLAVTDELDGVTEQSREAEAEVSGRVRLRFVQADADFDVIAEEAVLADEATHAVTGSEMNMSLTRSEGRQIAERWLTEARVAREALRMALPPSRMDLGAGDVIELPGQGGEGAGRYRIDRVEQSLTQLVDAVRIEPQVYDSADLSEDPVPIKPFVAPVPVISHFLDLPLLRGDEVPHAPHIAITADPWPGAAAVFQSGVDADYTLNSLINARATVGVTKTALPAACAGLTDHGPVLEVKLISGQLETVQPQALLSGANTAAIGDGTSGNWEIFQFAEAELIGQDTYWLRGRLRGQAGSGGLMPEVWPEGSIFVLLDGTPKQIELSPNLRRVAQHFRIGPAGRGYDDPSYQHVEDAFDGNGLRPFSPCHLRADLQMSGDARLDWIRRTRIGGDGWEAADVPLGEDSEAYLVQVRKNGAPLRQEIVTQPSWTYSAAAQTADGAVRPFEVRVAQLSAVYGAGLAATVVVPG
ncbi:glycoside hydrolase/phage tail family protein [Sulfitobacter mediterraneus]|uniref:baseplate multidomain protein megatron n=1 Tax=Sulfitobacter mediterraneus TaxID=83219 RepID=UPI001939D449|nr:glycoside hydrolase/phage tail family protein [Sulfitobacter mediterraneus]MBM1556893.1 glycoside hydrolase/phage tail family protein [Sulfitobacter mediterraneus]MBM1569078.1 glycoside hydrolase/phage tail family protein [Sulfitobacter mediterraneus]MBM1572505.1 glycoside hydrolase/phage tail family protein [Sulfitobacter mediterraneus]MBM1576668.1 glycoside hydrolase/phage tail family protein [Sulfitobacter mediterraneus]MBM1579851.1 glycoside hydrolase/phage tail family protein [Sulfitob